jgi:hypothetical protein
MPSKSIIKKKLKKELKPEDIIKKLRRPGIPSLVYFCYFYPRTQNELKDLINPQKSVCFNPLISWRRELQDKIEALEPQLSLSIKNIKWKSSAHFLAKFCIDKINERKRKSNSPHLYEMDKKEEVLLEKFFDSDWFREFFSNKYIDLMVNEGTYNVGRDEKGKLWVSDSLLAIISVAKIIFSISYAFYHYYEKSIFPPIKEIENISSFDKFGFEWYKNHIKTKVKEKEIRKILEELEHYPSEFIKQLTKRSLAPPYYVFSIPPKLYDIFSLTFGHTSYVYEVEAAIKRALNR